MKKVVILSALLSLFAQLVLAQASVPTVSSPVTYCQGATASALTATAGSSSDTLYWYTTSTGGTGTKTAPVPSTATAGTTSYYVSAKPASGAESARDTIDVIVNPKAATPVAPSPITYCQYAMAAALTATKGSSSDTLLWYTAPTAGTGSKTAPTPSTMAAGTTTYYVSAKTAAACEGAFDTLQGLSVVPGCRLYTLGDRQYAYRSQKRVLLRAGDR